MGGADELFGTEQTPSVSGADQLFAGEEAQTENRLKFIMDETIDETPERTARALEIQKRTGIPKKFIDENFDEIDRTARQADFEPKKYTKSNPKISEWLSRNPDYAPLIREDESVSAIEGMVRVAENTIRSIGAAPSRAGSGLYGVAQAGADVLGADTLSGFFSEQRKSAAAIAESIRGPMKDVGPLERAAYSGIESATQTALMLPAAILSGSPAPLLYTMSAQTGGEAYGQARDKGRDVATSLGYGASQAVIGYATEMIPASKLLGDLIGNSGFVKTITNQLLAEIPGEQVATILQDLNEWAVLNPEQPFSSYLEERPSAAAQTLVATIVGTSAQTTVAYGGKKLVDHVEKRSAEKQAKVQEDFFKALGENATNSKLRERLPDSYQEIIAELTKDGPVENVYAPVEFFQTHFSEQGIDPAQLAKELGIERQYQEAVNTGGKIAIPTAIYAKNLAPTEHNAVFAKELSFAADQMSARETEEFLKEAEKEKPEETDKFKESLDQAMTPIREQLNAIYPADIAEKNATVIEARLRARADRLGVDPQELMKQRPISITETEGSGDLNQLAYHGSPHKFDKFSMGKIGTGEGAQAYGHGLYFAESPEVANEYAKTLGKAKQAEFMRTSPPDEEAILKYSSAWDEIEKQIEPLRQRIMKPLPGDNISALLDARDALVTKQDVLHAAMITDSVKRAPHGPTMYKVDISDSAVKNFLDWDKPLSEQPESVRKALEKIGYKHDAKGSAAFDDALLSALTGDATGNLPKMPSNPTGADIYRKLAARNGSTWLDPNMPSEAAVSAKLKELGIPGIRYLDQASRGAGKGTSNFVVFEEDIVKILDVNGKPVSGEERKQAIDDMKAENTLKQSDTTKQIGNEVTRGSISVTPTGDIIRLFKSRNLSTLLHEFGHRWLFELQDDAALENAPQQIKDDLAKSLKYLGVESVEELDITKHKPGTEGHKKAVAANEKWAQSIEVYLKEGKAPSTELRRVFAQIKAWLVAVYDALKQGRLDVELSPEIRGVFDRLLATDHEIKASKSQSIPIFTKATEAGMTDVEFSAYRKTIADANRQAQEEIDAKIMKEYKRTLTGLWKEDRAKVQAEVEAELDKEPIYQAMAKMEANAVKIARADAPNLPRNLTAKDGMPADMAAEMLGFTSGESLVRGLASVENRKARVNRETNSRMDIKFGNMLTDGTLIEEVKQTVMSDARAKIIEAEMKALHKKAKEVQPFTKAKDKQAAEEARAGLDIYKGLVPKLADVRARAVSVIASKPIREIAPNQYYNVSRKASREAVESVRKKKYLIAAYHKGRELLNLEMYRAAISAKDEIESSNDKLQKAFVSDIKQSKTRDMDMVNAARAILSSHGLGPEGQAPDAYLTKLRDYDPQTYDNLRPLFEPAIQSSKNFKDMTLEEYIWMRDAVLALMNLSRRSKQIKIDDRLLDRDVAVQELATRMDELQGDKKVADKLKTTVTETQQTKSGLLSVKAALRRVEHWVDAMDGGKPGVFRKYIWNPVIDGVNAYREEKRLTIAKYLEMVQEVAPTIKQGDIEAPEIGFKFRGKNELLHAILHTGNLSNKTKLLMGYGWGEVLEDGSLNTARWDAFERRMQDEGVLTKADYDFAQNVWNLMEDMKPKLQKAHHSMYGFYFAEVSRDSFTNKFGTYEGGYIPAKADPNQVQDAEIRRDREELLNGQNTFAFPTTGKGATMKRVAGYNRPLQLDMRSIPQHIDWAMRFAHIEPAVKDVARIVTDKHFSSAMGEMDRSTITHLLTPWLQRAASQRTSTQGMNRHVDKFWTNVRTRTGMQIMVANVINTLQQYTGITVALTKIKAKSMRSAMWTHLTNSKADSEEIAEKSVFMRNRVFTAHNEIIQTIDDLLLNPSKYEKVKDFANKHGYFMQQATQSFVDQVVWRAAYNEAVEDGRSEKESVRHADSVVRETQGSFSPEDISRAEAHTPFARVFMMFYNYFNTMANLMGTEFSNIASNGLGVRKGAGRAFYVYTMALMIPAFIGDSIIRAVFSGFKDDDDDGYMDDLIAMFFGSQARALLAMAPGVGQVATSVYGHLTKKPYDDHISASPVISVMESAGRAPVSVYKAIMDDGNEKKAVKDTLNLIGLMTGLPAGALSRPLGYLADVHQGKANPEDALDVARGLISGQDVNR